VVVGSTSPQVKTERRLYFPGGRLYFLTGGDGGWLGFPIDGCIRRMAWRLRSTGFSEVHLRLAA